MIITTHPIDAIKMKQKF